MKNGAVLAGAIALAVSTGASAQSTTASGLLRQIGGALSGKSGSQAKVSHPLYAEPAGMYWDLDGDTVHQRVRDLSGLPTLSLHTEEDFLLEVFVPAPAASVARREGLV